MDAAKQWTLPKALRDFRYHITEVAVQRFRERVDEAIRTPSDRDTALQLDAKIQHAYDTKQVNDIVDASCPAEVTKIAQITVRPGIENYVVLRMIKPNSYPPPPTVGGPAGPALGAIDLVPIDIGQQRFANGHWKVAFRQLEGPLTKLLREQQEAEAKPAKPTFEEFASKAPPFPTSVLAVPSYPTTPQGTPMDAPMPRKSEFSSMNEFANSIGPNAKTVHVTTSASGRRHYSDEYARRLASEWGKSGLSQGDFAKKHDIHPSLISRWAIKYKVKPSKVVARPVQAVDSKAKGHTNAMRKFMADDAPHTIEEVAKAVGYDQHNCGIQLSRLYKAGELKRPKQATYQATSKLHKAIEQYNGKGTPVQRTSPVVARPASVVSANGSTTEQRREFALQQFRLYPDLKLTGPDSCESALHDRFGIAIKRAVIADLREQARKEGAKSRPTPINKRPKASGKGDIHSVALAFADAIQREKDLGARLVELQEETTAIEAELREARQTASELLQRMQTAHG